MHRLWPNEALPGRARPGPADARATSSRRASSSRPTSSARPVGPDLDQHLESLKAYEEAGVDELFVQQIGPEQDLFFDEWAPEILKRF